jgi:hypothetical protein
MTATETVPTDESVAEGASWLLRSRRHVLALLAACPLVPFAVLLVRVLAVRSHLFLYGDQAVVSVAVRRALSWQQTLGIYDRFGWHHPGPSYFYLVATAMRVLGSTHAAQAQMATVIVVNGACAVGSVIVVGRRWGTQAAAATAVVLTAVAALMGASQPSPATSSFILNSTWTTYLVIFPLVFAGVLAAVAIHGSLPALVGSAVAASYAVQADISPAGLGALFVLVGVVGCSVAWWKRGRPSNRQLSSAASLGVLLILMWVPPIIEQFSNSPGNLTLLWRFFVTHPQPKVGLVQGATQVGNNAVSPFGVHSGVLQFAHEPGLRQLLILAAGGIVVLLVALLARAKSAVTFAALGLAGLGVAVYSASDIVGFPASYLTAWTAVPVILLLIAAALLVVEAMARLGPRIRGRWDAAFAVLVLVTFGGLMARVVTIEAAPSAPFVPQAWHLVAPVVDAHHHQRVGLVATDLTSSGVLGGVADELDSRGVPFSVPAWLRFNFAPGHTAEPNYWLAISNSVPPGFRVLGQVQDQIFGQVQNLTISVATMRPPGWP